MFGKNKENKNRVNLFGVFKMNGDTNTYDSNNLLCVTSTLEESYEYITKKAYLDNEEHYKMWCQIHNKDIETSFEEYVNLVLANDIESMYSIVKLQYTAQAVSAMIRGMLNYQLVGASYENELDKTFREAFDYQDEEQEEDIITNDKVC